MTHPHPRFFLDSADRARSTDLFSSGLFYGLTTNPTILDRDGCSVRDIGAIYEWAHDAGAQEICFQAWGPDAPTLLSNAQQILNIDPNVIIKLPATRAGFIAARRLEDQGTTILITAVYRASQMALAQAVGAHYVAPYFGRINDSGRDALKEIATMQEISERGHGHTQVLAASLRTIDDVAALCSRGVPAMTLNVNLAEEMLSDSDTVAAALEFERVIAASRES
ncbi:transaldolase family protein [Demequina sediminicola]|uniref:transaldolase family protein n=1 Tax=Demequina sediminicola TaxID=1095026 RepID=UPI000786279D|nr:transaldolase family protein [Demequina sediminicola]